jgi:hypothetical protein
MARFDISILGDRELEEVLRFLPENLERKVLNRAIKEAAKIVLDDAKRLAPVDSGQLKRALHIRTMRRKRGRIGYLIASGTRSELGIADTAKGFYPAAIHYGWFPKNVKAQHRSKFAHDRLLRAFLKKEYGSLRVPARPYLRQALLQDDRRVLNHVRDALRRGLEKLGKGVS